MRIGEHETALIVNGRVTLLPLQEPFTVDDFVLLETVEIRERTEAISNRFESVCFRFVSCRTRILNRFRSRLRTWTRIS